MRHNESVTKNPVAEKPWLALWILLSITWGFSFLFIKVAGQFLDQYQTTFGRMFFGAAVLLAYLYATGRRPVTSGPAVKHLAMLGQIAQAIPFILFAWAEHSISSISAGLVNSTMSLWTGLLAIVILPEEKLNRTRAIGLVIGFIGILVLLGVWDADFRGNALAYFACALSTIGYAVAVLWTKRFVTPLGLDPIGAVATQLTFGAISCGIAALIFSSAPTHWPATGVLSVVLLGALGTGFALVLNYLIIQRAGAIATSLVTYSIPIVSTLAGVLILHEALHWYEPVGAVIILLGIALVQQLLPRPAKTTKQ